MKTVDEIVGAARRAKSLMHREELVWMCELAQLAPKGLAVEVGVYLGSSLIGCAWAREERGPVIGVDNWSYKDIENLQARCEANLLAAGVSPTLLTGNSSEAAAQISEPVAFCFIDGDHTKTGIETDIKLWIPKIAPNGIVVFHDYGRRKNDCYVTEAVDHWHARNGWEPLGCVLTTIGFRRKP